MIIISLSTELCQVQQKFWIKALQRFRKNHLFITHPDNTKTIWNKLCHVHVKKNIINPHPDHIQALAGKNWFWHYNITVIINKGVKGHIQSSDHQMIIWSFNDHHLTFISFSSSQSLSIKWDKEDVTVISYFLIIWSSEHMVMYENLIILVTAQWSKRGA